MVNQDAVQMKLIADALLEQLPIGVILTDQKGEMVYVNKKAESIRKVRREDLLGHNVLNCHQDASRSNVQRAMDRLMLKPESVFRRMVEDTKNDRYYQNTYAGLADREGNAIGMAVLSEDITDKRKMELEHARTYQIMQATSESIRQKYYDLWLISLETIANILEKRDPYTHNHSQNVCRYSLKMYEYRYGIDHTYDALKTAATLHDIGKIGIPDTILHKPGRLSPEEFNIIKHHSEIAEEILKPLDSGTEISRMVRHHHEHFDGSGYPDGLSGMDIPNVSRVIAIADAYDAMHSDRPYRTSLPYDRCIAEIMAHAGTQFDPDWTEVFLELAGTGSL